jgi:hypothetical protein
MVYIQLYTAHRRRLAPTPRGGRRAPVRRRRARALILRPEPSSSQPMRHRSPLPPAFLEFLELFNRGAYWESHEVLERPWRVGRSGFYKGLILLASALVHAERGNRAGVVAQLRKAAGALEPYRPAYLGVDVDALLAHVAQGRVLAGEGGGGGGGGGAPGWADRVTAVRLEVAEGRVRGDEPELAARE